MHITSLLHTYFASERNERDRKREKKVDILRDKTEGEHTKRTSKQNRLRNQAESTPPLPHQDDTKMNIFFFLFGLIVVNLCMYYLKEHWVYLCKK